jgi:hypothetical protein
MFGHTKCIVHGWPGLALENLAWHSHSLQVRGRARAVQHNGRRCAERLRHLTVQGQRSL